MSESSVRATILVTGSVQGVFFRASAMEEAQRIGLMGWVCNLPDGGVESVVEGPRPGVEEFVKWCHDGPSSANVEAVKATYQQATGEFDTFRIVR